MKEALLTSWMTCNTTFKFPYLSTIDDNESSPPSNSDDDNTSQDARTTPAMIQKRTTKLRMRWGVAITYILRQIRVVVVSSSSAAAVAAVPHHESSKGNDNNDDTNDYW